MGLIKKKILSLVSRFVCRGYVSTKILLIAVLLLLTSSKVYAVCAGLPLNPIIDICYNCMFPYKFAGMTIIPGDVMDTHDLASFPICSCPIPRPPFVRPGIPISFWEAARIIETVKDPWCFPTIGTGMSMGSDFFNSGSYLEQNPALPTKISYQQSHYYYFPLFAMLNILTDVVCLELSGFDLAWVTEVDPSWQSEFISIFLNPEALLFANPAAQMSCIPDAVASNAGLPLSPLFWCMGSWGSTYPLSGYVNTDDYLVGNAAVAARSIFKMGRIGALCDVAVNLCTCVPTPIWVKQNYRFQLAKPVRDATCYPIGKSDLVWGAMKNPPTYKGDNFSWIMFRKRACCSF